MDINSLLSILCNCLIISTKKYKFADRNSSENVSYYRLKQLDYDGKFEYTRIVAVNGFREQLALASVPNPGSQRRGFLLVKGSDNSGRIALTVFDVKGALIYRNDQFELDKNKQIPLSILPELMTGLYIAKVISGDQRATVSFMIADRWQSLHWHLYKAQYAPI